MRPDHFAGEFMKANCFKRLNCDIEELLRRQSFFLQSVTQADLLSSCSGCISILNSSSCCSIQGICMFCQDLYV